MDMPAEATAITFSEDSEVDFPKKIKHRNHVRDQANQQCGNEVF